VGQGLGDINGDEFIVAADGDFESDYRQRDPADTEFDGKGVGSMEWGSFTIGHWYKSEIILEWLLRHE
jgi:hypothetical protein